MIGYGYKLWRVAVIGVAIITLGALMVHRRRTQMKYVGTTPEDSLRQSLNCVMYSLDVFVPVVDLQQVKHWLPSPGWLRGWSGFR